MNRILGVFLLALGLGLGGCKTTAPPIEERRIGGYTVRLEWPRGDPKFLPVYGKDLLILQRGKKVAESSWVLGLHPLTGKDITGDGYPDVVVEHYSGGAHCCYSYEVFSLGPNLQAFQAGGDSPCPGEFRDLDGDGVYELILCDGSFAYRYCSFADSPLITVVLRFLPGQGYVPAGPDFPGVYLGELPELERQAEGALGPGPFPSWDGTPKCLVLPLVLTLLYAGEEEKAWEALYRYYPYPDVEEFRADITEIFRASPYTSKTNP